MWSSQCHERPNAASTLSAQPPPDRCAPIVADDGKTLPAKMIRQSNYVPCKLIEIILVHAFRFVAEVITPLVGRNNVKSPFGKWPDLISPTEPELGKPMKQEHKPARGRTGIRYMKVDSVGGNAGKAHDFVDVHSTPSMYGAAARNFRVPEERDHSGAQQQRDSQQIEAIVDCHHE